MTPCKTNITFEKKKKHTFELKIYSQTSLLKKTHVIEQHKFDRKQNFFFTINNNNVSAII